MKNLKSILTALAVVTVVGSSLALTNTLGGAYCVKPLSNPSAPCAIIPNQTTTNGLPTHQGFLVVDPEDCTEDACNASLQIRLIGQD